LSRVAGVVDALAEALGETANATGPQV